MAEEHRRDKFRRWLMRVWDWADDENRAIAEDIAELVAHSDDPEYPLWGMARKRGVLGDGELAQLIRRRFGTPPQAAEPSDWEKQINYSPVIWVDEQVWQRIYDQLGWVNRDLDPDRPGCLWLWSNAANMIRFQKRKKVVEDDAVI